MNVFHVGIKNNIHMPLTIFPNFNKTIKQGDIK